MSSTIAVERVIKGLVEDLVQKVQAVVASNVTQRLRAGIAGSLQDRNLPSFGNSTRSLAGAPSSRASDAIERTRQLIERRFAESLSLDLLAREAGLSKFHLARRFHAEVGKTIHRYLMEVRLDRALARVKQGERAKDVAGSVGFADQAHMTRLFRAHLGRTPKDFYPGGRATARPVGRARRNVLKRKKRARR